MLSAWLLHRKHGSRVAGGRDPVAASAEQGAPDALAVGLLKDSPGRVTESALTKQLCPLLGSRPCAWPMVDF